MADKLERKASEGFAEELGKGIASAAKRKLDDMSCFRDCVKRMKQEAKNLEDVRADVQSTIDVAWKKKPDDIVPRVNTWFTEINKIQVKMNEIEAKIPNPESGLWNRIKSGFSLGEEVKMITQDMENLQKVGRGFNSGNMFKSRDHIEDGIVEVLSRREVKVVGICGMGGSGKTTLAEKIMSRMKEEDLFHAVVKVVVSRPLDNLKIQRVIIHSLIQQVIIDPLYFEYQEKMAEAIEFRARLLCSKLQGPKKILILLDDIRETFSLEELGIPREGGCATLITSRDQNVLKKMCDNTVFEIGTLPQDEAQCLFEEKAGVSLNDPNFRPMAEQILQECGGLPLAIATIGSALRNKMKPDWERALCYLKSSKPIKEAENIRAHIRVSYELLDDEDAKLLFLLCSLFPEDYCISISDLEVYMMGLKMLNEVDSLVEAKDRVREGVYKLKSCYLLLEGYKETEVKMHDVVRDVAISISKKEERMSKGQYDTQCEWISEFTTTSNEPLNHLIGTNFSNIRLLIIHNRTHLSWDCSLLKINGISILKGMQGLNIASFKKVGFESPPEEIEWPSNLLTLQLKRSWNLQTLSFVGNLLNLKILDCSGCYDIEELPVDIGRLNSLKLLNLTGCGKLQRIAPGVIKQLVGLEELKMLGSFNKWESSEVNDEERINVALNELEALQKLRCLEIGIADISLVDEKIEISQNLVNYKIRFGDGYGGVDPWIFNYEKAIRVPGLPNEITNSWIHKLLDKAAVEGLELHGDDAGNWANLCVTHHTTLKGLKVTQCGMLKEAIDSSIISVDASRSGVVFPILEHLELCSLQNLKQVFSGEVPFNNLREIVIQGCGKLLNLFLLGRAKDAFILQLEILRIAQCPRMEYVFISKESEDENGKTTSFPKLKSLSLYALQCLKTFWKGNERIEFPSMESLVIKNCKEMKSMVMNSEMESESEHHCENHPTDVPCFFAHKVTFGRLKDFTWEDNNNMSIWCPQSHESCFRTLEKIDIQSSHKTRSLFSPSMVKYLVNLNCLEIWNCDALEELLRNDDDEGITCQITFPKLEKLQLYGLQTLKSIAKGIDSIEFPMLEYLKIEFCPELKKFVSPMEYSEESGQERNYDEEAFNFFCDKKVKISFLKVLCLSNINHKGSIMCPVLLGGFFKTLERLEISGCHNFTSFCSPSMAKDLVNLNYLCISDCDALEDVLRMENTNKDDGTTCQIIFPKLKTLQLDCLETLKSVAKGIESIEFPMLEQLVITYCPKLKRIVSVTEYDGESGEGYNKDDDEEYYALCDEKVKFNKLKSIKIRYCHSLSRLFTSSVVGNLTALTHISIKECRQIKKVITCKNGTHGDNILFPSLKALKIKSMALLEMLCEWRYPLELSMLEEISVVECPNFKFLTNGSLSTPKLKKMSVGYKTYEEEEEWKVAKDFNRYVPQYVTATKKVWTLGNIHVSESCHQPLPLANAVWLYFRKSEYTGLKEYLLLEITSNDKSEMRSLMYEQYFSISGVPILDLLSDEWLNDDEPLSDEWLNDDEPLSDESLNDEPLSDESLSDEWLNDEPLSDEPLSDEPLSDEPLSDDDNLMSYELNNYSKSAQNNSVASLGQYRNYRKYLDDEPDLMYYIVYTLGGVVYVSQLHVDEFTVHRTFKAPAATYMAFNPQDSNVIAIGMDDSTIQIYDWRQDEVITTLKSGHKRRISGLAFSEGLDILVSSGADAQLCVWSINGWEKKNSRQLQVLPDQPAPLEKETRVHFFNHGYRLLVVHESQIAIYDPTTQLECLCMWSPRDPLPSHVSCATASCDGRIIYVGFYDGAVGIFDAQDLGLLRGIASSIYISSLSPNDEDAFPRVMDIAAHPAYPHQFALGLSNGTIYVIQPLDVETESEGSSSHKDTVLPSSSGKYTDRE